MEALDVIYELARPTAHGVLGSASQSLCFELTGSHLKNWAVPPIFVVSFLLVLLHLVQIVLLVVLGVAQVSVLGRGQSLHLRP